MRNVELRYLARFERQVTETDDHGQEYNTWVPAFEEWVGVRPGKGRLQITEQAVQADQRVERGTDLVLMRYRPDVTTDMRLTVEDAKLGIVRILDIDFKHEWLEIECILADATKFDPS